jgi:hypothetical protein
LAASSSGNDVRRIAARRMVVAAMLRELESLPDCPCPAGNGASSAPYRPIAGADLRESP